uniref:Ternary complex factor MIP1 leucine-zipper domain-containing protein n=1 Tax=Oryza punctata TaxID=4537 RepID=A0A0E0M245_ORYPU
MHTAPEMNGRVRRPAAATHGAKAAAPKSDRMMEKDQRKGAMPVKKGSSANAVTKGTTNRIQARRERKLALQQDVDKLKKKLRHEENVHRALERAFTRPLGALPRLPPYLPSQTLALLAEVAVLEEEVVRLEEQVVNFRQGLYQEAIIFSSAKNTTNLPGGEGCVPAQLMPSSPVPNSEISPANCHSPPTRPSMNGVAGAKQTPRKPSPTATVAQDDRSSAGKENQSCSNTPARNCRHSPLLQKASKSRLPAAAAPEKRRATAQTISTVPDHKRLADTVSNNSEKVSQDDSSVPNRLSEELLRCLLAIFSQMGGSSASGQDEEQAALSPSVSGSCESSEDAYPQDPYGILEFGTRDVGPYKRFHVIDATSFDQTAMQNDNMLTRKLKALLRRLSSVDLTGLSHQQKLAFWINIYNSCMMNAFLAQGIPTTPHMLVAMMPKATINVGGRTHSAMSIEHFILRLPYSVKHVNPGGVTKGAADDMTMRGVFGLEWPEPLVTFALSCGSWSSPAVRVYTAGGVEEELEEAKRDYLQAAVGVSAPAKVAIPKLLHWYLLDFAKDVDSLMDWVCLQLPSELRQKAMKIVEDSRRGVAAESRRVQVLPYEFRFRYLLAS